MIPFHPFPRLIPTPESLSNIAQRFKFPRFSQTSFFGHPSTSSLSSFSRQSTKPPSTAPEPSYAHNRFTRLALSSANQLYANFQFWSRKRKPDEDLRKKLGEENENLVKQYRHEYHKLNHTLRFSDEVSIPTYRRVPCFIRSDTMVRVNGKGFNANRIYTYLTPIIPPTKEDANTETPHCPSSPHLIAGMMVDAKKPRDMIAFSQLLVNNHVGLVIDLTEAGEHHSYHPTAEEPLIFKPSPRIPSCFAKYWGRSQSNHPQADSYFSFRRVQNTNDPALPKTDNPPLPESWTSCHINIQQGEKTRAHNIELVSAPTPDHAHIKDNAFSEVLIDKIITTFKQGRSVYVHCKGGMGRTGQLCTLALIKMKLDSLSPGDLVPTAVELVNEALSTVRENRRQDMVNTIAYFGLITHAEKMLENRQIRLEAEEKTQYRKQFEHLQATMHPFVGNKNIVMPTTDTVQTDSLRAQIAYELMSMVAKDTLSTFALPVISKLYLSLLPPPTQNLSTALHVGVPSSP